MAYNIDKFWEILEEIQSGSGDLTEAVKAIAKSEQVSSERFIELVIDQIAFNTADWQRLKRFYRDWYAAHRTVTSFQSNLSDVYQMPNNQLDELFRSFGYDLSASLRDPVTNEAPLNKINFFLDLVNLYKRKGTPQALVDVLRYYGINDIDVYELQLQFDDRETKDSSDLIFKGKVSAGTTGDITPVYLDFNFLTQGDPHWLQTEDQIKQLVNLNKINFPSQSPYFAVKPLFNEEATDAATGILTRQVQDQYAEWDDLGQPDESVIAVLPQNAVMTITGDTVSLLTLYLSTIYTFNKEFSVGSPANRFICYDGTTTDAVEIINEFKQLTEVKVTTRAQQKANWLEYLDLFSRDITTNFLQTSTDAGDVLAVLNPTVKTALDNLATDNISVLGSLLNDLGEWVRNNLSYGFINMSYILFGIDSLFNNLKQVIEFFKPYRARLVPLETIEFSNRLFNSIIVEDEFSFDVDVNVYDFVTGDSNPCCTNQGIDSTTPVCLDATATEYFYSRDTYDCGSWHDVGAVTDIGRELFIELQDSIYDSMRCPAFYGDGTAAIEIASNLGAPFAPIVTSETIEEFYDDSTASATITDGTNVLPDSVLYYQTGGFENFDGVPTWDGTTYVHERVWDSSAFTYVYINTGVPLYTYVEDTEGRFDCTHGFDLVQIEVQSDLNFLLQENGDYLLQENGSRIYL